MLKYPGLGINVLVKHDSRQEIDIYVQRLMQLGTEWVRLEFDFVNTANKELTRYFVEKCRESNIKVLGLLSSSVIGKIINLVIPQLGNKPVYKFKKEYSIFAADTAKEYRELITHWEILNEVNTRRFWVGKPNPKEYVEVLQITADAIKSQNSNSKIVFAGILGSDTKWDNIPFSYQNYYKEAIAAGAADYFDIASFHLYGIHSYISRWSASQHLEWCTKQLQIIHALVKNFSDKELWITEFGIGPRYMKMGPQGISKTYATMYQICRSLNIPLFIWTLNDWIDSRYEKWTPENYFGLLDVKLTPKPTFDYFTQDLALNLIS